jgi:hypothetical protein
MCFYSFSKFALFSCWLGWFVCGFAVLAGKLRCGGFWRGFFCRCFVSNSADSDLLLIRLLLLCDAYPPSIYGVNWKFNLSLSVSCSGHFPRMAQLENAFILWFSSIRRRFQASAVWRRRWRGELPFSFGVSSECQNRNDCNCRNCDDNNYARPD